MSEDRPVYDLLPAVHRNRDAELGHPLRALLEPVEEELRRLREDIDGLYDNWFVETCAEWVLPYLGDLLGVEPVAASPDGAAPRRAFIANTLRHRRRKGTPADPGRGGPGHHRAARQGRGVLPTARHHPARQPSTPRQSAPPTCGTPGGSS